MLESIRRPRAGSSMPPRGPAGTLEALPGGRDSSCTAIHGGEGPEMTHITYLEAAVVGLVQGVSEMFPVSSLGHNVLIPAFVAATCARDLHVPPPQPPY